MSKRFLAGTAVAVPGIGLFAGCGARDVTAEDCYSLSEAMGPIRQLNPDDAAQETASADIRQVVEELPDGELKEAVTGIADELEAFGDAEPASDEARAHAAAMSDHQDAMDEICGPLIQDDSKSKLQEDS